MSAESPWEDARVVDLPDEDVADWPTLPDKFWEARPVFEHVRRAAWSRMIPADAAFGAFLARVSYLTDHRIVLPPVVGRWQPLNLMSGLIGESGDGKGSSMDLAEELLRPAERVMDLFNPRRREVPEGSGEGVARAFSGEVLVDDGKGKTRRELQRIYDSLLIRVDEGEALAKLGERSGSTLWSYWRRAWSGERLGATNATKEHTFPVVEKLSYRLAAVVALQPVKVKALLDDSDGGTPQRFLWFSMVDPSAPIERLDWPGPLTLTLPKANDAQHQVSVYGYNLCGLGVASAVQDEIVAAHHAKITGKVRGDRDGGHRTLNRLKVAGLLCGLDGRLDITVDDWELAEIVVETSDRMRDWTRGRIAAGEQAVVDGRNKRAAEREEIVETARMAASAGVRRAAQSIARHVWRADEPVPRGRCRADSLHRDDRILFEAGLDMAIQQELVTELDGKISRGVNKPAGVS